MLYWCHRYENTSKESQEHIFDNISLLRSLSADPGHESDLQNQENHQKCDFSKIHILLLSGRKYDTRWRVVYAPNRKLRFLNNHVRYQRTVFFW